VVKRGVAVGEVRELPTAAEGEQVLGGGALGGDVVDVEHVAVAARRAADRDHGEAGRDELGERRVVAARVHHDHAVDPRRPHQLEVGVRRRGSSTASTRTRKPRWWATSVRVKIACGKKASVSRCRASQTTKPTVRVRPARQRGGRRRRDVAQLGGGLQHALAGLVGDALIAAVEHEGDGRARHAGPLRHGVARDLGAAERAIRSAAVGAYAAPRRPISGGRPRRRRPPAPRPGVRRWAQVDLHRTGPEVLQQGPARVAAEPHALGQRQHRQAGLDRQRAEQARPGGAVEPGAAGDAASRPWRRIVIAATPA
jgi:hypothetical protein